MSNMIDLREMREDLERAAGSGADFMPTPEDVLALVELAEAMKPVAVGLSTGDALGVAWTEWPESRDLQRVAAALSRFDFSNVS